MMEKHYNCWPGVKVIPGQDFSKCKIVAVPMQSMSLREIIKRFVRRESLPVSKDGIYEDRLGDLEKMVHEDITVTMDRVASLKSSLVRADKAIKDREKPVESPSVGGTPPGGVTGSPVVGQAPPAVSQGVTGGSSPL